MGMERTSRAEIRSRRIFHWIAPFYGMFFTRQARYYATLLDKAQWEIDLSGIRTVLDVGCGTGALCSVMSRRGFAVTGVDPVRRMLDIAARRLDGTGVVLLKGNVLEGLPFENGSLDLVIASYVAHGMNAVDRRTLYAEMNRIARNLVIFHDYNHRRSVVTDLIEWLEGGDYFAFIRDARTEMKAAFQDVRVLDVGKRASWYVCVPKA
jgi:SAM-dependent methyltransferase